MRDRSIGTAAQGTCCWTERNVIVGRQIPAGTGLAYHEGRRRNVLEELQAADMEEGEIMTDDDAEKALAEELTAAGGNSKEVEVSPSAE